MSNCPRWDIRFGPLQVNADIIGPFIISNIRIGLVENPEIIGKLSYVEYSYHAAEFMHVMNRFRNFPAKKNPWPFKRTRMEFGPICIKIIENKVFAGFSFRELVPMNFDSDKNRKKFINTLYNYDDNIVNMQDISYIRRDIRDMKRSDDMEYQIENEESDAEFRSFEYMGFIILVLVILFIIIEIFGGN